MTTQDIFELFKEVCHQLHDSRALLSDATETIVTLEAELAHLRYVGNKACGRVDRDIGLSNPNARPAARIRVNEATIWIEDLWLSKPKNADLLGVAEIEWIQNPANPQAALNFTTLLLKQKNLGKGEEITCILFQAAVLLSMGKLEEACAGANEAIKQCGHDWNYKDLRGIGRFIRGRYLLERRRYRAAYWDLSLAVLADEYADKAKDLQEQITIRMREDRDDRTWLEPSTGPSLSADSQSYSIQEGLSRFSFQGGKTTT